MKQHHHDSIERFLARYGADEAVVAVLLAGSLAHGYARPDSDIDVLLVVSEEEFQRRKASAELAFSVWDRSICTYEGGYVDCKVVSLAFLETLAERGSDPARYAFKDAKVLLSRQSGLDALLARVVRFNDDEQPRRRHRFACQLLAWKWYFSEAIKNDNAYLVHLATQKVMLFSSRLVLNENRALYPYHKRLLNEVSKLSAKPRGFDAALLQVGKDPSAAAINQLVADVLAFVGIREQDVDWPNQFLQDSELNWLHQPAPVDDV
jgi:hypothetical protein